METIHTDSAYRAVPRTMSKRAGINMAVEKSVQHDDRRTLIDSNVQDPTSHMKTKVITIASRFS
jgi:phosphatidylinositol glycan class K